MTPAKLRLAPATMGQPPGPEPTTEGMASFSFALNRRNLANAGENAATMFLEFLAARIRNLNTGRLTPELLLNFWRGRRITSSDIGAITPMHVAAYIEKHPGSPQTIKQHLAAIKMLFDYLVIRLRVRPKQQSCQPVTTLTKD
jgi:hypothetical protein